MFMKPRKVKIVDKGFEFYIKKQDFSASISEASENVYLFVFISSRQFYIRRNNNKVDSIETGRIVIANLLP